MDRTAEEFAQQLPDGRWVVADYEGSQVVGKLCCITRMLRMLNLTPHEAQHSRHVVKYASKGSCKRAAQRVLNKIAADEFPTLAEQVKEMKDGEL